MVSDFKGLQFTKGNRLHTHTISNGGDALNLIILGKQKRVLNVGMKNR